MKACPRPILSAACVLAVSVLCATAGVLSVAAPLRADAPDWSRTAALPAEGHRANIYSLTAAEWKQTVRNGKITALTYPVGPTGLLIPYRTFSYLFDSKDFNLFRRLFRLGADVVFKFGSTDELFGWIGLQPYPQQPGVGPYDIPYDSAVRPTTRMGLELRTVDNTAAFTFGCAECHVGTLFGKTVFGMTNRFPRGYETFLQAKKHIGQINNTLFKWTTHSTATEMAMISTAANNLSWVNLKAPQALGLDTSLAQVGLSLSMRGLDPYAEKLAETRDHPRANILDTLPADSKPSVWWNTKYKTRWLADGSVVSGNPVFTNFLWNEIGRSADLKKLETWLDANAQKVKELTSAVFASEAPRYTDFFPADHIDITRAKDGETTFNIYCSSCHGQYEKNWSRADADTLDAKTLLETARVIYHDATPVVDVGTDSNRYKGMAGFADRLNGLAISKKMGTVIEVQQGYVPPPLVGIWARWPYFHNNAAPSLCAVLTSGAQRPTEYYSGAAVDPKTDFDEVCNGYPLGNKTPQAWKDKEHTFNTRLSGLSNRGHDEGIFLNQGQEMLTTEQKLNLIQFLKTL